MSQAAQDTIAKVTFRGSTIRFSKGEDSEGPFVVLPTRIANGAIDQPLELEFNSLSGGATAVCDNVVGSFVVCNYVLYGSEDSAGDFSCCAQGDVPVAYDTESATRVL